MMSHSRLQSDPCDWGISGQHTNLYGITTTGIWTTALRNGSQSSKFASVQVRRKIVRDVASTERANHGNAAARSPQSSSWLRTARELNVSMFTNLNAVEWNFDVLQKRSLVAFLRNHIIITSSKQAGSSLEGTANRT